MTLPTSDPGARVRARTIVRPNGQRQNSAIRAEAMPNGIVTIRMNITSATIA